MATKRRTIPLPPLEKFPSAASLYDKDEEYYSVAVYWIRDCAYGGPKHCKTIEEADKEVEMLLRLGYGKEHNPIHVRHVKEYRKIIREVFKENLL